MGVVYLAAAAFFTEAGTWDFDMFETVQELWETGVWC
jgi:hypothetical protein